MFKSWVRLEVSQSNFKITVGMCVFKKICSTLNLRRVGSLFDKFHVFIDQNLEHCSYGACQPKASLADSSEAVPGQLKSTKSSIAYRSIANQVSKANQASKAKQSEQAKNSKPNKSKTSNQTDQTKPS